MLPAPPAASLKPAGAALYGGRLEVWPDASKQEGGFMNIRPLHDRLIVKREAEERKSPGGIVIPDTAAEKPTFGKVIAVGKGKVLDNGGSRAPGGKDGDKIMFGKYSGTEVKVDGQEFLVMREEDVMAIVESG